MSTTVDTLITKYVLDDSGYVGKASRVQSATGSMGSSFGAASSAAGILASGVTIAGAAVVALGMRASKTAANYEVLRKGIETVTGSASRAQQVFDFAQAQAGPSAFFDTGQLARGAQLLETFKLKTEEFLPLANTMASLFGQNEESLNGFIMALGRIKAGSFGEGFERLREMGVTRPMLEQQGAKFGANGQFQGTTDAALKAIEAAIKKNFGGLDAAMGQTFQAQIATSGDLVEQAFGQLGKGINEALIPSLKGFNDQLQKFVADGSAEKAGNEFADLLESFKGLGQGIQWIANSLPQNWFAKGLGENLAKNAFHTSDAPAKATEAVTAEMQKDPRFKGYMKRLGKHTESKDAFTGETPNPDGAPPPAVRQNTVFLGEIAHNTRESARLQRMAFGFGASSVGVTTVELAGRGTTGIRRQIDVLVGEIEAAMIGAISQNNASNRQAFGRA
jgi:hypothetical protein